jgi:Putative beta-barrel porin-2, OmpL-like. bbp2
MQGSTLYLGVINGFNSFFGGSETLLYVGGTITTPVKGLKLGASYDYAGSSSDTAGVDGSPYVNALALYASFQATEKLSFHTRGEYANTDLPGLLATARPGLEGDKIFALTGTIQYDLWKNVLSRLEIRWDHSASGNQTYGGDTRAGHSGVPNERNAVLVAANVIYKF